MSTPPPLAPKRLLVVDDEPGVCDAVKLLLEFDGHHVETARSAKEALALFEVRKFDVVITDLMMPQMNGDELAKRIKALDPRQPVVMITARMELLESKPAAGIDCLVSKPFLLAQLREALAKVTAGDQQNPPA
jgi:CheY-like chemotaxis protein